MARLQKGLRKYIGYKDLKLWPHGSRLQLGFSYEAARLLVRGQVLGNPKRFRVLTDKTVDESQVEKMPTNYKRQQVSVIAQENLKLAVFLFHHWLIFTFDLEVMRVHEDTVHLLAEQKRLKDEYKDPDLLSKVNKADIARTIVSIKEYFRSYVCVVRVPLASIIKKTKTVQTYGDYPKYAAPDDKMITRMSHLPQERLKNEQSAQSVNEHMAKCQIENISVYSILDQLCKETDLYPYVKQHKSKRNGRGAIYSLHSRWLSPHHVDTTASEAKLVLQMFKYDRVKKA